MEGKNAALEIYLLFSVFSSCNCANRRSGRSSWAEAVSVNSAALGMLFSWPDSMLIPGIMETLQRFLKELEDFTLDLGEGKKGTEMSMSVTIFSPTSLKYGNSREWEPIVWRHSFVPGSNIQPPLCGMWEELNLTEGWDSAQRKGCTQHLLLHSRAAAKLPRGETGFTLNMGGEVS